MTESNLDVDKQYRTTSGVDSKYADIASDDHALKRRFGSNEDAKKIEFEAEIIGERVAQWYDDPAAAIREYLSNAETAGVRRARQELLEGGHAVPDGVTEMLEAAKEKCDYEPIIEVTFNRNPEATRLVIEDNGIGISTDEYLVLKKIGYSTSHMDGERLGQFGMGYMSGFQLTGTEGVFNMRTRSFLTDETYSTANYITNFEYLDGLRDNYGTRFEFPSFCQKAEGINIRNKVAEFAEGMRVTVLYREMDSSGQEVYNEDYVPTALSSDYDESALVIEFENEYFEAVMSPHSPKRRGYKTYNVSMPIRRNTNEYGTEPKFNAPWTWDFRGKQENGPIVKCESDQSVVGLAPVSDSKYENLPDERKAKFIRRGEVPDDAVVMPTPASSRDSYESGHDDFWRHVSDCLVEAWGNAVAEQLEGLNDFDDFKDAGTREKHIIVRGYQKFGPGYGSSDTDTIVEELEKSVGVTVPDDVADKLDKLQHSHRVVKRGADNPSYKKATTKTPAWEIIDNASGGGTVYMGKTISPKKAEIAWDLHDNNQVVRLEDADYDTLSELWGWSKLKDLPSKNLKEKLPALSDTVAEKWETMTASDAKGSGSSGRRTSRDPKTRRIKVYGRRRRTRRSFTEQTAEHVFDNLDGGDTVSAGWSDIDKLIIFNQNDRSVGHAKRKINQSAGVGVTVVPKYVYNYLKDADNVYTSEDELREKEAKNATVMLSGDREVRIDQIPDGELVLVNPGSLKRHFDGDRDTLREWFEEKTGNDYKNLSFVSNDELTKWNWVTPKGGDIIRFSGFRGVGRRLRIDGDRVSKSDVISDILLPDNIDWDHEFMKAIKFSIEDNADKQMTVVKYLKQFDALPTTDDN